MVEGNKDLQIKGKNRKFKFTIIKSTGTTASPLYYKYNICLLCMCNNFVFDFIRVVNHILYFCIIDGMINNKEHNLLIITTEIIKT